MKIFWPFFLHFAQNPLPLLPIISHFFALYTKILHFFEERPYKKRSFFLFIYIDFWQDLGKQKALALFLRASAFHRLCRMELVMWLEHTTCWLRISCTTDCATPANLLTTLLLYRTTAHLSTFFWKKEKDFFLPLHRPSKKAVLFACGEFYCVAVIFGLRRVIFASRV